MNDNSKSFSISYSGAANSELQKLKEKYTLNETNYMLEKVKRLDQRVDFISTILSIALGILGSALLISGTIIIIRNIHLLTLSLVTTTSGLIIVSVVPLIHSKVSQYIKKRTAPKILAMIKEIEQNNI